MKHEKISASIDPSSIRKASKFWAGDLSSIYVELLQNAFRAGASEVLVTVEPERISVKDNGRGVSDPSVLLRFGGSGWHEEMARSQDAAGMGVFCLARTGCEVTSRSEGEAEGWSAVFTPEVFAGEASAAVAWGPVADKGTCFTFPWKHDGKDGARTALEGAATYAPMKVKLVVINDAGERTEHQFGLVDFLAGAVRVEEFGGYRVGVFGEYNSTKRVTGSTWTSSRRLAKSAVNFHGLVIEASVAQIEPVQGDGFIAHIDLHDADEIHMTLPQRNGIVENAAWHALRQNAREAILRHIASLETHSFGFRVFEEARTLGLAMKEAVPRLCAFEPVTADRHSGGYDLGFKPLPEDKEVVVVDADFEPDLSQSFDHVGLKLEDRFSFMEPCPSFKGYGWYDGLTKLTDVTWRIDTTDGVIVVGEDEAAGNEKEEAADKQAQARLTPEQIDDIEAIISFSRNGTSTTMTVPTEFLILAGDWSPLEEAEVLVTREAKNNRLVRTQQLVSRLMDACFCYSDDGEADSYDTQRDAAEEEATRLVNSILLSEREAAIAAIKSSFERYVAYGCRALSENGAAVTITYSNGTVEVTTSAP